MRLWIGTSTFNLRQDLQNENSTSWWPDLCQLWGGVFPVQASTGNAIFIICFSAIFIICFLISHFIWLLQAERSVSESDLPVTLPLSSVEKSLSCVSYHQTLNTECLSGLPQMDHRSLRDSTHPIPMPMWRLNQRMLQGCTLTDLWRQIRALIDVFLDLYQGRSLLLWQVCVFVCLL